jgi:hypothetical protein
MSLRQPVSHLIAILLCDINDDNLAILYPHILSKHFRNTAAEEVTSHQLVKRCRIYWLYSHALGRGTLQSKRPIYRLLYCFILNRLVSDLLEPVMLCWVTFTQVPRMIPRSLILSDETSFALQAYATAII